MAKWVYKFQEGNASMRNLLGGKGCNLAEMTGLGMPIPQGFTVTTEACTEYYNCGKKISVFGESHIEEIASKMDLKVLGKMPIDPSLAELSDKGDFAKAENKYLTDAFEVLHQLDRVKKEEE